MYNIILVRFGEIALKGKNRYIFENKLISNMKSVLNKCGNYRIEKTRSRIYIYPENNIQKIIDSLKMVPGIVALSPALKTELDFEIIKEKALKLFKEKINKYPTTFRVSTNRANKSFPGTSIEISRKIGAHILTHINKDKQKLSVDLENFEHELNIEIRKNNAYIYTTNIPGPGGLPVGTSEKGLLLLSGGIDSPVAGWSAMRRGIELEAVYFHSFPYTGDRAKEKVIDLCKTLSNYGNNIKLYIAYFTSVQQAIQEKCRSKYYITIMRRMMFRIATELAKRNNDLVLITGENLGQVASQTLESLSVINAVTDLPVLRPLITRDKNEIIATARYINTYETSIQPYEDCCTIMVPDNPVTKPRLKNTMAEEKKLNIEELVNSAIEKTKILNTGE